MLILILLFSQNAYGRINWQGNKTVDLWGNTYNAFQSVSIPAAWDFFNFKMNNYPSDTSTYSSNLGFFIAHTAKPNTYTANAGLIPIEPSCSWMEANKSAIAKTYYLNTTTTAGDPIRVLIQIDGYQEY